MKKFTLSFIAFFICTISLFAQISQEQADVIVFQYIQTEIAAPYLLYVYTQEPNEEGMVITTHQEEIIEVEYACRTYYLNEFPNQSTPRQHRYLFVKEDDGNLLEVITANDLGVTDFTDWMLSAVHNATLSNLSVSMGELEPEFSSDVFNYTVDLFDAEEISIIATTTRENATVSGTGTFELQGGENIFTIQVIAEDGVTELDYTIVVTNTLSLSQDATLSNLSISSGELTPAFSSNVFSYTVNLTDAEEITIAAIPAHANATVSGTGIFPIEEGENSFTIHVVAEDGVTELDYTIVVTNTLSLSQDATLSNLSISSGDLTPAFSSNVFSYTVNLTDAEEITIAAIPAHANATVSGTGTFSIEIGENCFTIHVVAEDGVTELDYTIVVNNSLNIIETQSSLLTVYPNPTTGELRIENGELRIDNVEVFDVYGKIHLSPVTRHSSRVTRHPSPVTINISHLPAGLYFVKITTEAGIAMRKVIKN